MTAAQMFLRFYEIRVTLMYHLRINREHQFCYFYQN